MMAVSRRGKWKERMQKREKEKVCIIFNEFM